MCEREPIQGDNLLAGRGYGFADLEQRIPMNAATTLVRAGSISKLFVSTAVMQLVEAGTLDLDADVNRYRSGDAAAPEQAGQHSVGIGDDTRGVPLWSLRFLFSSRRED